MKLPPNICFDISRAYIDDNRAALGEEIYKVLSGWIRSRSLPHLTSTMSLLDPLHSMGPEVCRHLMQVEAFFKKNAAFSDEERCGAAAMTGFLQAEQKCRITNRRLDHYFVQRDRLDPDLDKQMKRASRYVQRVLGSHQTFMNSIPENIRVTSGATATLSRKEALPPFKVNPRTVATTQSIPYLVALGKYYGYKVRPKPLDVNRVEFVPKNWKTHRTIACEPDGVLPLQLAFDSYAKRRLRLKTGIDLSDQSRNQELAKEGSENGTLSTVDLSAASDTLAYNTVMWLIPHEWVAFLEAIRSKHGQLPNGELIKYAKFSSMGNGVTFVLESLIFAAACYAIGSEKFRVYGDDIIVETELYSKLERFLRFLGFSINDSKSHYRGPFRESCGGNYYNGVDVTPFYIREMDSRKSNLSHLCNGLMSISWPGSCLGEIALKLVQDARLPLVPYTENTTYGIWIDPHTAWSRGMIKRRHNIVQFWGLLPKARTIRVDDSRALFLWHLDASRRHIVQWSASNLGLVKGIKHTFEQDEARAIIRSRSPSGRVRYRLRWVNWVIPVTAVPLHIYMWSDALVRPLEG